MKMKIVYPVVISLMAWLSCTSIKRTEPPVPGSDQIHVNQVGFMPESPKSFILTGYTADSFCIFDADGLVVHAGAFEDRGVWEASGEKVLLGTFSSLKTPGIFQISVKGLDKSWPFRIGEGIYNEAAVASLRTFYLQRMSMDLEERFAGKFKRPGGHPDSLCFFHPSSGRSTGTMSSPGGWYDAGDYNKYIVNAAVSVGAMLNLAEIKPGVFGDRLVNIPESSNGKSDYLDEIKYELDWMLTMQDDDGGVFHKLSNKGFDGFVMPVEATSERYVIGKSTAATLDFAAVLAMAGRIYKGYDPDFAKRCLLAATKAWKWAKANPRAYFERNPEDIQTGAYGDVVLNEEFFWAAAELWTATGEAAYLKKIEGKLGDITFRVEESWRNYVDNLGYYSLLTPSSPLSDAGKKLVLTGLVSLADSLSSVIESHPYRIPLHHFKWGSNSDILNLATIFIVAHHYTKDRKYLNYALETIDYIFGKNATGYSFVTGFGGKAPMNIHHRPSAADSIAEPFPGFLVGGPNIDRQDQSSLKDAGLAYAHQEPARCYIDALPSYASNEICLNWNAPLTFVLGYLAEDER